MKKIIKIFISFALVFALLVTSIPMYSFAATDNLIDIDFSRPSAVEEMNHVTYKKDSTLRDPKMYYEQEQPQGELVSIDEYSKTYQISESEFITQIDGNSNLYIDNDGEAQIIDNTLTMQMPSFAPDYFENTANDYIVKLPTEINTNNGVKIEKDGYTIEMIPTEGDFSRPVAVDNAVLYNDVFDGIDYQYTALGDIIKEDIVLNKAVEKNIFTFIIKANGLNIQQKEGAICLFTEDETNPVYTIVAPEMSDASGRISTNIDLSLSYINDNHVVTLVADYQWLNSEDCAYPVRIDPTINVSGSSIGLYGVEQGASDSVIGDNNYPYCGYDDGVTSSNLALFDSAHLMTRTYASINYDFSKISKEAKINKATFSLYHYTAWSDGKTNFGLYQVDKKWIPSELTWNYQKNYPHTFIQYQKANKSAGWLNWNVTDVINSWVQGLSENYGFVVKAENERNMQCEVFQNKNGANPPKLTIEWSIPDPVDTNYPLDETTVELRPITEKNIDGKQIFDAVFADGTATPEAIVKYWLSPDNVDGYSYASVSYKYPDSTYFESKFPDGTKYKDKKSNWQTQLFSGFKFDKTYNISATATKNGITGKQADSDKFLIYKIKRIDTYPYIAKYYGVSLDTLMRDNRVQDNLVVENNTIFIRNPKTEVAYTPEPLSDNDKKAIDSALMGRGKHCKYGFEPVNLNTGNFYFNTTDVAIPELNGEFSIERTYNSKGDASNSLFGRKWSFAYDENLSICEDGKIAYSVGDGKTLYFTPDDKGGYTSPSGYYYTLKKIEYEVNKEKYYRYEIHETDGSYKKFNAWGLLTDIIDEKGFTISIQYDDNYNIKSLISPTGKSYEITCDGMGRISNISMPNGAVLRYEYNDNNDLVKFIDANGNSVRYVYDTQHRMTEWYDQENNRVVLNTYDSNGRVTEQTDANGNIVRLSYTKNQTVTTDANNNVTTYTYDDYYRTTKIEYPNGKVENMSYDEANNLLSDYDYTYTYDNKGNKLTETAKDGTIRSYTYNTANNITSITDFDGNTTRMEYSPSGDLVKTIYADGTNESYNYDEQHRLISHTNANGNTEYYAYDGAVATEYEDFNGNKYEFSYNSMNQLITTIAPDDSISRKMYNAAGTQIGEQAPDGGYTEYTLDKIGNITRSTDAMGYASDFVYDGMYNIVKGTDPKGNTLVYTYDGNANKLSETNAEGYTTNYAYDCMNNLIKVTQPNGAVTEYEYDIDGNIIKTVNPDGSTKTSQYDTIRKMPLVSVDELANTTTYTYNKLGKPLSITYADGSQIKYEYDVKGRLVKFVDETGLVSEFEFDANGNITKFTENKTREYLYKYDKNNNLVQTVDSIDGVVSYEYDALNRQTKVTNQLGASENYEYDAVGRLIKAINAAGNAVQFTYDKNGNMISSTSANDAVTQYVYNEIGNLISEKDALNNITNYSYDKTEQIKEVTDALGNTTSYEYDSTGNVVKTTDALGNAATVTYDIMGNVIKVTLDNGDTTTFEYDLLGRPVKSVDAAGLETSYTYDCMGRILEVSNNTGSKITYEYDKYGRLLSQTDVIGRSEKYEYDDFSQVIAVTGTDKNKTTLSYDKLGRLVSVTDAENKTTEFKYDLLGNLIEQTEEDGKIYKYAYDLLNQVTSALDPVGAVTGYSYDTEGNLTSVTDSNGITKKYAYDKLNRLVSAIDGNGNATSYEYDELSRLIAEKTPEGSTTEYCYDAVNNLTKLKDANGFITEYVFDMLGNVTDTITQKGATTSYTYDKHNNVTSITDPLGNVTKYDIDLNGLTTQMTQPNGAKYTYSYDAVNRLKGITTPKGYTRSFTYDDLGNLTKEKDNLDRVTTYEYDIMHRVTKTVDPNGAGTSYSYDKSGNLSSVVTANGAKTSFAYNLIDQVISKTDPENNVTTYDYDKVGNITSVTESGKRTTRYKYDNNYNVTHITDPVGYVTEQKFDKDNRIIAVTNAMGYTTTYEYDALGQTTKTTDASDHSVSYSYDAHGNIVKVKNQLGSETKYTYDLADRLIKVTDPMLRETSYTYDSMGNLTEQKDADNKTTRYTYDVEGNMLSITDDSEKVEQMTYDIVGNLKSIVRPDNSVVKYDYDKLNNLASKTYSEDQSSVLYLYDNMGNRLSMTDTTGETEYKYDVMGRVTSVTSADDKTVGYSYDKCGRLAAITYADGRTVSYKYDLNDRLVAVNDGDEITTYAYDGLGRITETARPNGSKTLYTYDETSSLVKLVNEAEDGSVISSFEYKYNEQGYITEEIAKDSEKAATRAYKYNHAGEIIEFTENEDEHTAKYEYYYDNSGNRTKLVKKGVERPETISYQYDSTGRLISETSTVDGTTKYNYDKNGNLISEQNDNKKEITYEYTVEQRLSAVREGGSLLMAASYDGDNNRIFQVSRKEVSKYVTKSELSADENNPTGESADSINSITKTSSLGEDTQSPPNDTSAIDDTDGINQDNVKSYYEKIYVDPADTMFWYGFGQGMMEFFGNINAALSSYLSNWFCQAWDYVTSQYTLKMYSKAIDPYTEADIDKLRSIGLSENDIEQIANYVLDSDGHTVVKYTESDAASKETSEESKSIKNGNTASGQSVVIPENPDENTRVDYELTYYVNNVNTENTQVLMEYGKRNELKNVYTYGNERIAVDTIADTYNTKSDDFEKDYYLYDGRGSVAQVVSNTADVLASYSYDPFGALTEGAPTFDSFYGYNAEDTNPVTGLQYLRARYYNAEKGRFDTIDSYLGDITQPLTLNRYSYTVNNPVMKIDPSGHWNLLNKVVNTVKNGIKKAANWVNNNIVKPVVKTVKSAASWVNNNIIQPVKNFINNKVVTPVKQYYNGAKQVINQVGQSISNSYQNITATVTQAYRQTQQYIQQRTNEIKQKVYKFSCGIAKNIVKQAEQKLNDIGIYPNKNDIPKNPLANDPAPDISNVNFEKVIYLNNSDGAYGFGHSAIILVTDSDEGYYYSVNGDMSKALGTILGGNIQGTIETVVDKNEKVRSLTKDEMKEFYATGNIYSVHKIDGSITQKPNDNKKTDSTDHYDRYIIIPVTNEEGEKMYNKAEEYRTNKNYTYSLYENNCGMVAQDILNAGGKSFATSPEYSSSDEQKTILKVVTKIPAIAAFPYNAKAIKEAVNEITSAINRDIDDYTIPNAAYMEGKQQIDNGEREGWDYEPKN